MKTVNYLLGNILPYIYRHWFKIGVMGMALFVILNKDLSFNIKVQAPLKNEQAPAEQYRSSQSQERETLTEHVAQEKSETSRFNFFSNWGGTSAPNLIQQLDNQDVETIRTFVQRFLHVAEGEQEKFGIPASIILANAVLQSQAGTRTATQNSYNFFTLPCTNDWQGPTVENQDGCLRKYDNAWLSFRDHSLYITSGKFSSLKHFGVNNYEAWANGLEEKEFLEIDDLASQLIQLIEGYQLFQLD